DYEIQVDKLVYAYDPNNKNRLLSVTDASSSLEGFAENMDPNGTSNDDYAYDANGNMTRDDNKAITNISYNHLNLPFTITFYNPHGKQTKIEYIYDAAGSKKSKKVHYYEQGGSGGGGEDMKGTMANATPTNSSVGPVTYIQKLTQTDYMAGGFQYKDEALEFIPHAEGFIKNDKDGYVYYFNYADHLGNVRVTYTDDGNGTPYVVEESNYYPFGLKHKGYNEPDQNPMDWGYILTSGTYLNHKYKYNGKEFQDELGLNFYDYGARNYDPAIGRWMNIDPLAETYYPESPYTYAINNPVHFIDPDGRGVTDTYGVDKRGNIQKLDNKKYYDKNGKEVDRLYKTDDKGAKTKSYAEVEKNVLKGVTKDHSSGNGSYHYFYTKYGDKATKLYEFLAENTEVEWSKVDENNTNTWISTSHSKIEEYGGSEILFGLVDSQAGEGNSYKHSHSHPTDGGIKGYYGPSGFDKRDKKYGAGDKAFATTLKNKYPRESVSTNVYSVPIKSYSSYNKNNYYAPIKKM
ncbi:hypothetical protein NAT51_19495, partial [Flavobacterium amniphilum]|uniref:RHS repeat-associated core domain-containing protein n=1 Tax=Flavobacterium amniphilum TaxID=1834035 RepID=UPI00293EBC5B